MLHFPSGKDFIVNFCGVEAEKGVMVKRKELSIVVGQGPNSEFGLEEEKRKQRSRAEVILL